MAAGVQQDLRDIQLPSRLSLTVRLLRDKALVAQGRGLEARDDLRKLLETSSAPEARYWLAWAAEQRGELDPAVGTYLATWTRHAASPWSDHALQRLQALEQVPSLQDASGRRQTLQRATNLRAAHQDGAALELLRQVEASDESLQGDASWTYEMARACFKGRDYPCAVERYQALGSPLAQTVPGGAETLFHHALATSRVGDYAGAAAIYTPLFQRFPTHSKADFASYKVGYLAFDEGRLPAAIHELQQHLTRYPSSRHADEALWFIGWSQWRLDRPEEAARTWSRLLASYPSSSLAPKAFYWQRVAQGHGLEQLPAELARRYPNSGYNWLARLRQHGHVPAPVQTPLPALPAPSASFLTAHPELSQADALQDLGFQTWAGAILDDLLPAARRADSQTRLAIATRLVGVGRVTEARKLAGTSCGSSARSGAPREICLPRPHFNVVSHTLEGTGLDPYLPYAIMTAESAMKPEVTSLAGARGLMQLMPEVGERVHEQLFPDRPFHADDLYLGSYNAALGSAELLRLYRYFHEAGFSDPLPLVIAAYNGGADAVDRWLEAQGEGVPMDVFCENIGYSETRRYVGRVLGYLWTYHRTYGGE